MELEFESFKERIEKIRKENIRLCNFHSQAEKIVDMVRFIPWLRDHDKLIGNCSIWSQYKDLDFHFSNTPIDEFIEEVLGTLHRKLNILWQLELTGEVDDPTFRFTPVDQDYDCKIYFYVKEGEFKVCKVEEIIDEPDKVEFKEVKTSGRKHLKLICE